LVIVVGALITLFGLATALMGPRVASTLSRRSGGRFEASNRLAFRVIGTILAAAGLFYAMTGE
jgi:hypothetical protein